MSTDIFSACANCGKGEEDNVALKNCVACMMVKYCSRDCQKAHRPQHKKECRLRAAELHDEKLFKQPPQLEDCPICFMRMPTLQSGYRYMPCCGKIVCCGCLYAVSKLDKEEKCPFCRAPAPKSVEEGIERVKKRVEVGDAQAMYELGSYYSGGSHGLSRDMDKALELWHRAGKLGCAVSYYNIALYYGNGRDVERDMKKTLHYWELAAIGGEVHARFNLGCDGGNKGNMDRALKHMMIAVEGGYPDSLKPIKKLFGDGHATRDDYAKALQAYQAYLEEIKSVGRDEAAAYSAIFKYCE